MARVGQEPSPSSNFRSQMCRTKSDRLQLQTCSLVAISTANAGPLTKRNECRERTVNTSRAHLEEVNVAGLQPGKTYSMRVVAFNGAGASGPGSRRLTLTTALEPHILAAPAHLHAGAVSPVSLLARWAPPPGAADAAADAAAPTPPVRHYKLFYMEVNETSRYRNVWNGNRHFVSRKYRRALSRRSTRC